MKFKYKYENSISKEVFTSLKSIGNKISLDKSKVFRISGRNGLGKSFLMHLLAFAFFGKENYSIPDKLKEKINHISKNNLEFEIALKIDDNTELISQKKQNEAPVVYQVIDGKQSSPINSVVFEKQYELIYDFPKDATERISDISKQVLDVNNLISENLSQKLSLLTKTVLESSTVRDNDAIKNCKIKISKLKPQYDSCKINISSLKNDITFLTNYDLLKLLSKTNVDLESLRKKLISKSKKFKKIPKVDKPPVRDTEQIRKLEIKSENTIIKLLSLRSCIIKTINNHAYSAKIDLENCLKKFSDIDIDQLISLQDESMDYKKTCDTLYHSLKSNENLLINQEDKETKNLLVDLLDTFKNFSEVADKPAKAVFNDTTKSLIEKIERELEKYDKTDIAFSDFNECLNYLTQFTKLIGEGRSFTTQLQSEKKKTGGIDPGYKLYQDSKSEIAKLKIDETNLLTTARNIFQDLKNNNENNLSSFDNLNEISNIIRSHNSNSLITNKNISKYDKQKKLKEKESLLLYYKDQINNEEEIISYQKRLPESSYSKEEITALKLAQDDLEIFLAMIADIKDCIKNEKILSNIDMSPVNNYIIKSLGGKLPYQNKMNKIIDFDIINKKVGLEGFNLSFDDLSTGQSSSVYLAHSISNPDNKKLIVIIDEIGNMDDQSLSPVIEKLKHHEKNGNLVFSLLAQVDNNIEGLKIDYINGIKKNNNDLEIIDFI